MRGLAKFLLFIAFLYGLYYVRDVMIRSDIREQSQPFATQFVGSVTMHWNRAELDRQADTNLAAQVRNSGIARPLDFAYFAQLGARTSEVDCKLYDYTTFKDDTRNYISANYICAAQFEQGAASILLTVMRDKENAPWRIGYFDVASPKLQQGSK